MASLRETFIQGQEISGWHDNRHPGKSREALWAELTALEKIQSRELEPHRCPYKLEQAEAVGLDSCWHLVNDSPAFDKAYKTT